MFLQMSLVVMIGFIYGIMIRQLISPKIERLDEKSSQLWLEQLYVMHNRSDNYYTAEESRSQWEECVTEAKEVIQARDEVSNFVIVMGIFLLILCGLHNYIDTIFGSIWSYIALCCFLYSIPLAWTILYLKEEGQILQAYYLNNGTVRIKHMLRAFFSFPVFTLFLILIATSQIGQWLEKTTIYILRILSSRLGGVFGLLGNMKVFRYR